MFPTEKYAIEIENLENFEKVPPDDELTSANV